MPTEQTGSGAQEYIEQIKPYDNKRLAEHYNRLSNENRSNFLKDSISAVAGETLVDGKWETAETRAGSAILVETDESKKDNPRPELYVKRFPETKKGVPGEMQVIIRLNNSKDPAENTVMIVVCDQNPDGSPKLDDSLVGLMMTQEYYNACVRENKDLTRNRDLKQKYKYQPESDNPHGLASELNRALIGGAITKKQYVSEFNTRIGMGINNYYDRFGSRGSEQDSEAIEAANKYNREVTESMFARRYQEQLESSQSRTIDAVNQTQERIRLEEESKKAALSVLELSQAGRFNILSNLREQLVNQANQHPENSAVATDILNAHTTIMEKVARGEASDEELLEHIKQLQGAWASMNGGKVSSIAGASEAKPNTAEAPVTAKPAEPLIQSKPSTSAPESAPGVGSSATTAETQRQETAIHERDVNIDWQRYELEQRKKGFARDIVTNNIEHDLSIIKVSTLKAQTLEDGSMVAPTQKIGETTYTLETYDDYCNNLVNKALEIKQKIRSKENPGYIQRDGRDISDRETQELYRYIDDRVLLLMAEARQGQVEAYREIDGKVRVATTDIETARKVVTADTTPDSRNYLNAVDDIMNRFDTGMSAGWNNAELKGLRSKFSEHKDLRQIDYETLALEFIKKAPPELHDKLDKYIRSLMLRYDLSNNVKFDASQLFTMQSKWIDELNGQQEGTKQATQTEVSSDKDEVEKVEPTPVTPPETPVKDAEAIDSPQVGEEGKIPGQVTSEAEIPQVVNPTPVINSVETSGAEQEQIQAAPEQTPAPSQVAPEQVPEPAQEVKQEEPAQVSGGAAAQEEAPAKQEPESASEVEPELEQDTEAAITSTKTEIEEGDPYNTELKDLLSAIDSIYSEFQGADEINWNDLYPSLPASIPSVFQRGATRFKTIYDGKRSTLDIVNMKNYIDTFAYSLNNTTNSTNPELRTKVRNLIDLYSKRFAESHQMA